jgi:hypothetical protein
MSVTRSGFDPFVTYSALEETEIIPGKDSETRIKPLVSYTRTDTCVRWGMSVKYIAVKFCPFRFRNGRVTGLSYYTAREGIGPVAGPLNLGPRLVST